MSEAIEVVEVPTQDALAVSGDSELSLDRHAALR